MDPGKIFQIITNSTLLATRLVSGAGGPLQFSDPRYCVLLTEDAPPSLKVIQVAATHKDDVAIRFSITGGNRDGLFTIDQRSGLISLAAQLDYERQPKHELVVRAEGGGLAVMSLVQVTVVDVNDNPPHFLQDDMVVTIVEEDDQHLPATIFKVEAEDQDAVDAKGLVYSVGGEGLVGPDATFTINPHTGHLLQLKAVDRDPPKGRAVWRVKVQVRDGQRVSPSLAAAATRASRRPRLSPPIPQDRPEDNSAPRFLPIHGSASFPGSRYFSGNNRNPLEKPYYFIQAPKNSLERKHGMLYDSRWPSQIEYFQQTGQRLPDHRFVRRDPISLSSAILKAEGNREEGKEERESKEELEEDERAKGKEAASRKPSRMKEASGRRNADTLTFLPNGKNEMTDKGIVTPSKSEDKPSNQHGRHLNKKEQHISQSEWMTERKLLDKNRRISKEEMVIERKRKTGISKQVATGRMRRTEEDSVSEEKYSSLHPCGNDERGLPMGSKWLRETMCGSERHRKSLNRNEEWAKPKRAKYPTFRKHQQSGFQRKLLSFRGRQKPVVLGDGIRERTEAEEGLFTSAKLNLQPDLETTFNDNDTSPVNFDVYFGPTESNDDNIRKNFKSSKGITYKRSRSSKHVLAAKYTPVQYIVDYSGRPEMEVKEQTSTIVSNEADGVWEHDFDELYRTHSIAYQNKRHKRYKRKAVVKRLTSPDSIRPKLHRSLYKRDHSPIDVPVKRSEHMKVDRIIMSQLGEDLVYVKKYKAVAGRCEAPASFSVTSKEEEKEKEIEQPEDLQKVNDEKRWWQMVQEMVEEMRREQVHVAETVVTVVVKDINDNAPVFPNATMFGEVQENGPIDLSAGVVWAWDADDEEEGTNAILTYSIDKNVVDERSGEAIFDIDPKTGLVRTAICCLDRETTPEYHIQVVATDGGGLKGTGTLVVRLVDVNDNSPRLTRDLWVVEVKETWGDGPASNYTLLQVTTADQDTSNYFYYRVLENSGWGWQYFAMRTEGSAGQLYARETLDFEDPAQRRGFRFMIQVTDRGRGGWGDSRHTDTAWVEVRLTDVNDNPPMFRRPHVHVTVSEDTAPGALLASLTATDPDETGHQRVNYHVEGGWGALRVDPGGGVRLWRALDRETPGGEVGVAKVVGVDEGRPPLSSTATLTITVSDVNDCPPRLLPPTLLHVKESAPPSLLGVLTATDDDLWHLGHGPPFTFSMAPSNPALITRTLSLKYHENLDSGRGGAELWSVMALDREEQRQLTAEVTVEDSGGLAATHPVTVVVDDINDNPMKPGAKVVHVWKIQGAGSDVALGRVYVDDPDDWDLEDKTFSWAGPPHPLFTLQAATGEVFASTQLRERKYELHFLVSDAHWGQTDVPANMTVEVRHLSPESLAHAVPITLTPTSPAALAAAWNPTQGGGGLGTLTEAVKQVVGAAAKVMIVSVYGMPSTPESAPILTYLNLPFAASYLSVPPSGTPTPYACVWLSVRQAAGGFMDPVKLNGLLSLNQNLLEKIMKLRVVVGETVSAPSTPPPHPPSMTSLASVALPLQVVDTNHTSLVTPRLTRAHDCHRRSHHLEEESCTPSTCLNGGRCVRTDSGNRCLCPGRSWGPRCKVLARTFSGSGWAWVRPLPPCLPTTVSLRLLPRLPSGLILYSGPLSSTSTYPHWGPTPMLAVQLVEGRPQVVLEGGRGSMKLQVDTLLRPGTWHTLHLHLDAQGVVLMVDTCGRGWERGINNERHCIARAAWAKTEDTDSWSSGVPLQLGGLAHHHPRPSDFGWTTGPHPEPLNGCISHLTINGELIDLGEPAYSSNSQKGCVPQDGACGQGTSYCGLRGECVGGLEEPKCECAAGWMGPKCASPTTPVALRQSSFTKVTLFRLPDPYHVTLQLRLKLRGRHDGLLMQLATKPDSVSLKLRLRGGVACAVLTTEETEQEVCLESFPLGDGQWHTLHVGRHGHNLGIGVDECDGWKQNDTLPSLSSTTDHGEMHGFMVAPPAPLLVDKKDGVFLGGIPEFVSLSLVAVHDDLTDSCLDDVRVSGETVPLPPVLNHTSWGRVTTLKGLEAGCSARDACFNTTCLPPLTCHNTWRQATCSCGPGRHLVGHECQDVDECLFKPCLHGGTCYNLQPNYQCTCGPDHTGDYCQWLRLPSDTHPLKAPMAIAALTLSILLVVVIGVVLTLRHHRSRAARSSPLCPGDLDKGSHALEAPVTIEAVTDLSRTQAGTRHILSPLGLSQSVDGSQGGVDVSLALPPTSLKHREGSLTKSSSTSLTRCSIITVCDTAEDLTLHQRLDRQLTVFSTDTSTAAPPPPSSCSSVDCSISSTPDRADGGGGGTARQKATLVRKSAASATPLLAQDDLRAYAYEGDGSPSGSLSSTVLGLQMEAMEEEEREGPVKPLIPAYGDVLDLLKNLPDAVPVPKQPQASAATIHRGQKSTSQEKTPVLVRSRSVRSTISVGGEGKEQQEGLEECGRLPLGGRSRKASLEYSTVC
ncbi:putative neural-cadherin 2 isoform X2 [Portunus trituberculatus]|uniref:putative neural-cadherin 2 isoform X2 n=1 Tax=Portunus trituberculatus TaxID=210409 RepID=UPI001E1CCE01|nr:putative neural-cadherin 2 isoform X2 [Portunus trituberculatus]